MFADFEWANTLNLLGRLFSGALASLQIFTLTLLFSLPLGLIIALGRMSQNKWVREPIKLYILVMRGTPCFYRSSLFTLLPHICFRRV